MRIALVHRDLHQITRGGICTLYRDLAEHLVQAGNEVVLLTQDTPHPVSGPGLTVVTLPRTEDMSVHRAAVARAIDLFAPDVAECSTWQAELLTYAQQQPSRRVPVLVRGDLSAHTMGADQLAADERRICGRADAVVAVSEFAADDLAAAYRIARPTVIANGVDRTRFTPHGHTRPGSGWQVQLGRSGTVTARRPLTEALDDPQWARFFAAGAERLPLLVWVGKFTEMKGFDRLSRIAARLAGQARLMIVLGHGQVHYPVDLPDDVLVCQDLDPSDVPAVYRAADYLLSTSRWEGYGLAIAEALACGTPALLPADLGVAAELLTPGVTGQVWADEAALLDLLDTRPPLTGGLPARYTWQANARATLAIYQALLDKVSTSRVDR
ncbi:glycosyltransferase family 4 protein [Actinoplanes sp. NPDC051859]|uniref:glycosyltransferase family 4 protein n=1 Tax=Actinoplanes sp. NPDC051859 TaxID=3363909 RepID=UPI00378CE734